MLLALLVACSPSADPCTAMCTNAAALYGGCLSEWGAGWEAAGYADEADFVSACDTWAWEQRQLETDAGEDGSTDETCSDRSASFAAEDATCEDFTSLQWSESE